jgi:hypothetical protein
MPDPTIEMGPGWDSNQNHEAPRFGGWHGEAEVRALAQDGFKLLSLNMGTIRSRGSTVLGFSSFYRALDGLAQATAPNARAWTVTISKGIHQFKKKGEWYLPHITVRTPHGTAHFWLAIGKPVNLINSDVSTVIMPKRDDIGEQNYVADKAGFTYRVAQVSLDIDGPFFPRQVGCQVWTPQNLTWKIVPSKP